jgi:predicted heme/steroid binding protein
LIPIPAALNMTPRKFTKDELKSFDGRDGRPCYTACNGLVYDVSDSYFWRGGVHLVLHGAGKDLTDAMDDAPHGIELLEQFPIVGILSDT